MVIDYWLLVMEVRIRFTGQRSRSKVKVKKEGQPSDRPSVYIILYSPKLLHNDFGGEGLAVLVDLEHVDTAVEVGDIHLGSAGDGLAVHHLANDVEELDVSFLVIAEINGEVVSGGVRVDGGIVFLQFGNVHNFAIGTANFHSKILGEIVVLEEEHRIVEIHIAVVERANHTTMA